MRKILGFTAVAAVAAGIGLTAVPAWADDRIPTNTILSVDGNKSDVTLSLKDTPSAQYPQDHAPVTLAAKATWLSETGLKDVPGGDYAFYQNGENIGSPESAKLSAKLKACVTTFRAVYNGTVRYAESDSQTVTITLVGGHCPVPTPEPTEPTEEPSPSATVTATTTATTTATVTSPAPGATTVAYVQQPVEVVRVSSSGTGSPQFTG